jgi:uncharacterized protein (DUF302 family)
MSKSWRYWVTGGIAAVLAAASQAQPPLEEERESRSSRYSVEETLDRLQEQARLKGLPIFATLRSPRDAAAGEAASLLIVFGQDAEHTVVLQRTDHPALALPLTVRVAPRRGGGSEVQFALPRWLAEQQEMPPDLLEQVQALLALVDAALLSGPIA